MTGFSKVVLFHLYPSLFIITIDWIELSPENHMSFAKSSSLIGRHLEARLDVYRSTVSLSHFFDIFFTYGAGQCLYPVLFPAQDPAAVNSIAGPKHSTEPKFDLI